MIKIIKKLLFENKWSWDSKLIYAPWADQVNTKRSIGTSPFQIVYDTDSIFLVQLALPVMKFSQEELEEPNEIQRRMLQLIEVHQTREALVEKAQFYKDKVKVFFDKRTKQNVFQVDDMVLRWDV